YSPCRMSKSTSALGSRSKYVSINSRSCCSVNVSRFTLRTVVVTVISHSFIALFLVAITNYPLLYPPHQNNKDHRVSKGVLLGSAHNSHILFPSPYHCLLVSILELGIFDNS